MVAKKGKTTKKMKDLGARKVTSAQAKRIKGGATQSGSGGHVGGGSGAGKVAVKDWVMI